MSNKDDSEELETRRKKAQDKWKEAQEDIPRHDEEFNRQHDNNPNE